MKVKISNTLSTVQAPAEYFTGTAWFTYLSKNEVVRCNSIKVTFEPKARNYWHTHPKGQILIVTDGKGYVQKRGELIQLVLPGDVILIEANEEHWHGATPDSIFTHIAIQPITENGREVNWLSAVTELEYSSFKVPLVG